ncbi:MAG: glycosyltransferase family 2 protein [Elusimicrobiaceae bacterium]|nr:glycosyltransferase family 2 protein [Elusimicrobiaceae bacterium]
MDLKKQLEILLPTYNRKKHLERTLQQILAEDLPLKQVSITVLDNGSTDGTSELLSRYTAQYPNLKHIRHPKNIGGNANITRAFEMAKAEYVWVLADDDEYDFSHAEELAQALEKKPDALLVVSDKRQTLGVGDLFQEMSFVPAAIYRSEIITADTLTYMYFNIRCMLPHLAVAAALFNAGKTVQILPHPLVIPKPRPDYSRGLESWQPPIFQQMDWILGYFCSVQLLKDTSMQKQCLLALNMDGDNFYNRCGRFMALPKNKILLYGLGISFHPGWLKLWFALLAWPAYACSFYRTERGLYIRLFGRFKTKIWK